VARHVAEAVCLHIVAGQHQQHARHFLCRRCVDIANVGVRDARAHHIGLRRLVEMQIIGIAALAGDQGLVFETPYRLANAEFHDRS
jgi:hypothetical protein